MRARESLTEPSVSSNAWEDAIATFLIGRSRTTVLEVAGEGLTSG